MGKFLIALFVFLGFALPSRYVFYCEVRNNCEDDTEISDNIEEKTEVNKKVNDLSFMLDNMSVLTDYEHFQFAEGSETPVLSDNNNTFIRKMIDYLKANPKVNVTISGAQLKSEEGIQKGIYDQLGLARADAIKRLMLREGLDGDRFNLDYYTTSDLDKPIRFKAESNKTEGTKETEEEGDKETLTKAQYKFTNMTFSDSNFEYNSDEFKPGSAFVQYADSVKTYLDLEESKSISLIGHTDSKGSDNYNMNLGQRRAIAVKKYFTNLGVSKKRISTASKGEKQPTASNDTEAGRQKNRRVNVQIN